MRTNWVLTLLILAAITLLPSTAVGVGAIICLVALLAKRGIDGAWERLNRSDERRAIAENAAAWRMAKNSLDRDWAVMKNRRPPSNVVPIRRKA